MRPRGLLLNGIRYYWRVHLVVVAGVATAVGVLAGALLVGDSVTASLRDLFLRRLGETDALVSAPTLFREALAAELERDPSFGEAFRRASGVIATRGMVTLQAGGARAGGVEVYGVDERFWELHRTAPVVLGEREALVTERLARELGAEEGDPILLRLGRPSAVPAGSLHGEKEDVGRTMRLTARLWPTGIELAEFSIYPQQAPVRAVLVPLRRLQADLDQEGRINTVLLDARDEGAETPARFLASSLRLEDVGGRLRVLEARSALALESEAVLLGDALAEAGSRASEERGWEKAEILTYLANSIRIGGNEIPYSLVSALDEGFLADQVGAAEGERGESALDPIWLNEWAARDLNARPGDSVTLEYYVWLDEGRLETRSSRFELRGVVPMEGAAADPDLAPRYPGISDSENLGEWEPPFPIDYGRIRPRDEEYWDVHRTTPKAFIRLESGHRIWPLRQGNLTSIWIFPPGDLSRAAETYLDELERQLDPAAMGFAVHDVRREGLAASQGATDFGAYFTYFSFFLVVSALLLAGLFFRLGVEQRAREIGLLEAVGFTPGRIRNLFLAEGVLLAAAGSLVGLAAAVGYAGLILFGLTTWWVDAIGTELLDLHLSPRALVLGGLGGLLAAIGSVFWSVRGIARSTPRSLLAGGVASDGGDGTSRERARRSALLAGALILGSLILVAGASVGFWNQVAGFFGAGSLLLLGALAVQNRWLRSPGGAPLAGGGRLEIARLGLRSARHRPGRSLLCIALIAAATFIIVAVDAFRRAPEEIGLDPRSGTGGFPLYAESLLPILWDPNSPEGRQALQLDVPEDPALEAIRFVPFRVRPGDDASCLNLYRPRDPKILAPPPELLRSGRFAFRSSLAETEEERAHPWTLLAREEPGGAVPVIADANSMSYVLHVGLGDELVLPGSGDPPVRLRFVAGLSDSLFQSEILMSEENFLRLFPDREGFRFFLLDVPRENAAAAVAALEERLADHGFDVSSTTERIDSFHRVENTYLSTFQTLGGLGLVLGTFGLGAVLLRNVLERRRELALLRAVGYEKRHFAAMILAENALLLLGGLLAGTLAAAVAILPAWAERGAGFSAGSLPALLGFVALSGGLASLLGIAVATRPSLLEALRNE